MQYRPLGNSGLNASVVGLGTWVLGGGSAWGPDPDDRESVRAIQASLDAGVNLIDTAPGYGWGRSEAIVGKAIQGRRDQVILATKCGLWIDDDRGSFFVARDGKVIRRSLRPDTLAIEIERSLKFLGVDCIDLYQTHWPSVPPDFTPIADTMAALLRLKEQGKIRALGVSNVSLAELQENLRCGGIVSDQFRYSLLHREPERDVLPFCAQHNLATLTYMSLEQGLLTGKSGHGPRVRPGGVPQQRGVEPVVWAGEPAPRARPARVVADAHGQIPLHAGAAGHCRHCGSAGLDPCVVRRTAGGAGP